MDCLDIRDQAPGATNGIYLVDPDGDDEGEPYEVYCDMEHAGGGWTLVVVTSHDGQNTWTWDNRHYWDADETTFGSLGAHHLDFKSVAHHQVPFTDLLFVHAPSGEWASYNGVGDGEETLAAHIGAYGEEPIYWSATEGYPLTDGTLVAGGTICTDRLYFTAADRDNSPSEASYGPTWNTVNNQICPFDDPSDAGGLGPKKNNAGLEEDGIGFGQVLGLNTGSALSGANHMQVLVRRAVCGNGIVEGDEACDGGADCTGVCESLAVSATDCLDLHQKSPSAPSGTYTVDPDGDGGAEPYAVYCDMDSPGGGWTLCSAQHDGVPPVLAWGDKDGADGWYACHLIGEAATEVRYHATNGTDSYDWWFTGMNLTHGELKVWSDDNTARLSVRQGDANCDEGPFPDNYQVS
ncbi:MAG: fibrinogen-like YCDxxxxGGGW domain-containing protein, partial [Myxococcota bacterium]|nr:fibrinogen-like YCDxxxxGGGW domain-containing protein [Myxococcota bacterium]